MESKFKPKKSLCTGERLPISILEPLGTSQISCCVVKLWVDALRFGLLVDL